MTVEEIELADSFVLFLDLLGTRGLRTGSESIEHLRRVRQAVRGARAASTIGEGEQPTAQHMQWFSDNMSISYAVGASRATSCLVRLILDVSYLQAEFLQHGLTARGAIARGGFYADESFIYGPALERAVALEKGRARFGRCVLDEASVAVARTAFELEDASARGSWWRRHLAVDEGGEVFVDYLQIAAADAGGHGIDGEALLAAHRRLVVDNLHRMDGVSGLEEKYRWLATYHNFAVASVGAGEPVHVSRPIGTFRRFG